MTGENITVDVKSGRLFPFPFLILGTVFFIAGLGMFTASPIVAVILLFLGSLILTAYEGTEINTAEHTYREYNSFLFLKKGQKKTYERIERIFINSGKVTQKMYTAHTMNSSTFSSIEYNAYLKFSEGTKIFLVSSRNKDKLLKKLGEVATALNAPVVDNTAR